MLEVGSFWREARQTSRNRRPAPASAIGVAKVTPRRSSQSRRRQHHDGKSVEDGSAGVALSVGPQTARQKASEALISIESDRPSAAYDERQAWTRPELVAALCEVGANPFFACGFVHHLSGKRLGVEKG